MQFSDLCRLPMYQAREDQKNQEWRLCLHNESPVPFYGCCMRDSCWNGGAWIICHSQDLDFSDIPIPTPHQSARTAFLNPGNFRMYGVQLPEFWELKSSCLRVAKVDKCWARARNGTWPYMILCAELYVCFLYAASAFGRKGVMFTFANCSQDYNVSIGMCFFLFRTHQSPFRVD